MSHGEVHIPADGHRLSAELVIPDAATELVVVAHRSRTSRLNPRNRALAEVIRAAGIGTLLFDLLTPDEAALDAVTAELRFDIGFLAERLLTATHWVREQEPELRIGYFATSTGAAAALLAASEAQDTIGAVVSRGGRPDLAGQSLSQVRAPTLLIVGALDKPVIPRSEAAYEALGCEKQLTVIPGASHLFEEPGTLDQVARLAANWFDRHLVRAPVAAPALHFQHVQQYGATAAP
jgi:putative phosphoribosyl transferase